MSKYKILIFFTLFISIISISISCNSKTNNPFESNEEKFIKTISSYKSFDKNKSSDYYKNYIETNNIQLSMNKANHSDFFNLSSTSPFIKGDNHILVNPKYYLGGSFIPDSLVLVEGVSYIKREGEKMMIDKVTLDAYKELAHSADELGIELVVFSGFRSYEKQFQIYLNNPDPRYIAKPGHSEHQTGLALDISTPDTGLTEYFEYTNAFKYLQDYAYKYGFIMRYPKEKTLITGYNYEPWHYRYVGIDAATFIYKNNLTLEEYLYYYTILS